MTSPSVDPLEYHVARVLLLVDAFSTGRRSSLDGLTKLVKLDFLLRYPTFLDRLLPARNAVWPSGLEPSPVEEHAVESTMVRYKYGPWDDRYYPIIGVLIGKQLTERTVGRGRIALRSTPAGHEVADRLRTSGWELVAGRCKLLKRHFDLSGSTLKEMIYKELPDVVDRPWRSEIR